jgi:hypothetical protein
VLDPRRSKAARHSRGGSVQLAWHPTALMPLLSLLLISVLATALPLPPAVCIIAVTGLCCCVVLVRILLALSYSPSLPAAIPTTLPAALSAALCRQQPAANHHRPLPTAHCPTPATPHCQPTAHSTPPTAPRPISLRGHELPYVQHFAIWAATSARTAASSSKSAGNLQQQVQQCIGLQSSGAAGKSPLAPKREYMAAWCFRSCCMEQSPGPSRPPQLQRLEVFHRWCLRSILGVRRRDGISIEELLRRTQLCNIGTTICRLRLRWLGHAMRMPGERVARQVLFGQLRGTRPVGSPPVTLRDLMRSKMCCC